MVKIAVVGPEERKWKPEQIPKVREAILRCLLEIETLGKTVALQKYVSAYFKYKPFDTKSLMNLLESHYNLKRACNDYLKSIVLVSGHCPVGKLKSYCCTCDRWIETDIERETIHKNHIVIEVYDKGGVDTWAEIIATELGIQKEIYPAEVNQWSDWSGRQCEKCGFIDTKTHEEFEKLPIEQRRFLWNHIKECGGRFLPFRNKGFRSRNIQIAKACDVLYCIVPNVKLERGQVFRKYKSYYCFHCKEFGHPSNGGCWTMKYAKKLGKETHLVVIE